MKLLYARLTLPLTTLVLCVMLSLAILLGQIIKTYYVHHYNERLYNESQFIAQYIEAYGNMQEISKEILNKISNLFQTDIMLVSETGNIILSSKAFDQLSLEDQREISYWMMSEGGNGKLVEISHSQSDATYYRVPLMKEEVKEGYAVFRVMEDVLEKEIKKLWWLISVSFFLALFIILLIGSSILRKMTKSIDSATRVIGQFAKGDLRARMDELQKDDVSPLGKSVSQLANNLQHIVRKQEVQQERLSTLVENMGSGLVLIDGHGLISLINRTYKEIFQIDPDKFIDQPYYEAFQSSEVNQLVEEVFMTEQKVRRQILLPLHIERRHFEVYGAPIIGDNNAWKGTLLVFHDITELKKLEKTRKDFVANVSHELKTPITSIKGFSETLLDGALEDKEALHSFLSIILKESDRLQALIQDLLDLSKIEQEGFSLNRQHFNLHDLLTEIITILEGRALEKNISLTFTANEKQVSLFADIDRVKQVFINLINNAIAYTYENGNVTLNLMNITNEVIVEVTDTGIGMDQDQIPRIFERFYRIDKARSRNSGGTGLGLAIVKHIIEAHNGEIIVQSEIGKGTTFIVKLPK